METKKDVILSYNVPSREYLWLNPKDNTLRYFNGKEWVPAGDKESDQGVNKTTFQILVEIVQGLERQVGELKGKVAALESAAQAE